MSDTENSPLTAPQVAAVFGASGGIGSAFVAHLARDAGRGRILALSRRPALDQYAHVVPAFVDITDEASIAAAAEKTRSLGELRLVIVATGLLHGQGISPEKTWGALTPDSLFRAFAVNSIGPALVGKHFLPLLPRHGRSVFAALSARVGSIEDNRLGGWHAYRASKAALNMLLRSFAIELARRAPEALCIGLHPGTVDTRLSRPFQGNVAPGTLRRPEDAAARLLEVIRRLGPEASGGVFAWDGARLPA